MIHNLRAPQEYSRRALLAVAGNTPQILTETLYALTQSETPFVPTEVHVMTTSEGAHRIRLQLLAEEGGQFHAFCRDYSLTGQISFPPENVNVLHDGAGKPLQDIVSPQDNELAADQIVEWLRGFTNDPDCAIHACLAGGRKTMGFYLGYGLSLYGRDQDRLSHVLVSQVLENHRDFFYIPPEPRTLYVSSMAGMRVDERPVSTDEAQIWLAEIPFVRLRDGMPRQLLKGKASYTDSVLGVQSNLPDNNLTLDFTRRVAICGGVEVELPPREFAFYAWHAQRRIRLGNDAPLSWLDTGWEIDSTIDNIDNPVMQEYFDVYLLVQENDPKNHHYQEAFEKHQNGRTGFGKNEWAYIVHHINKRIEAALKKRYYKPFLITGEPVRKETWRSVYTLALPAEHIEIIMDKWLRKGR